MTDINDGYRSLLSPHRGRWDVTIYHNDTVLAQFPGLLLYEAKTLSVERLNYYRAMGSVQHD